MAQFISQWRNGKGDDTVNIKNIFLKKMPVILVLQLESVQGEQLS
jgi:hypothetical protein